VDSPSRLSRGRSAVDQRSIQGPDDAADDDEALTMSNSRGGTPLSLDKLSSNCTPESSGRPVLQGSGFVRRLEEFEVGAVIGKGGTSVVKVVKEKEGGRLMAAKFFNMRRPASKGRSSLRNQITQEIEVLRRMHHTNVVQIFGCIEQPEQRVMLMELMEGGELLDAVLERGMYSEEDARGIFTQLLRALDYAHESNIVHRDIKLENMLLMKPHDIGCIKLADWGFARIGLTGLRSWVGTWQYMSPEIVERQLNKTHSDSSTYNSAVDLWSAGVVLYILLSGYPPFFWDERTTLQDLFEQIKNAHYSFDDPVWDNVSDAAKDLVSKLMVVDPAQRLTAIQALEHPFIRGTARSIRHLPLTVQNLARFVARMRFIRATHGIIAIKRMETLRNISLRRRSQEHEDFSDHADE